MKTLAILTLLLVPSIAFAQYNDSSLDQANRINDQMYRDEQRRQELQQQERQAERRHQEVMQQLEQNQRRQNSYQQQQDPYLQLGNGVGKLIDSLTK